MLLRLHVIGQAFHDDIEQARRFAGVHRGAVHRIEDTREFLQRLRQRKALEHARAHCKQHVLGRRLVGLPRYRVISRFNRLPGADQRGKLARYQRQRGDVQLVAPGLADPARFPRRDLPDL